MRALRRVLVSWVALMALLLLARAAVAQPKVQQAPFVCGKRSDGLYAELTIRGAELNNPSRDGPYSYITGTITSRTVVLSGTVYVKLSGPGLTRPRLNVTMGPDSNKELLDYHWPPPSQQDKYLGNFEQEKSFSQSIVLPATDGRITFWISAAMLNGQTMLCGFRGSLSVDPARPIPTAGKPDAEKPPEEPKAEGEQAPSPPWGLAAGLGAAVLAAAVAGVVAALASQKRKPGSPEPHGYVLQVSSPSLKVTRRRPAQLWARVLRVTRTSQGPAPEALVQIALPHHAYGWVVSPPTGYGGLSATVGVSGQSVVPKVALLVTATGPGSGASTTVMAELESAYRILIRAVPTATLTAGDPNGIAVAAQVDPRGFDPAEAARLTAAIELTVSGPNADWLRPKPAVLRSGEKWLELTAEAPTPGAMPVAGEPLVIARLRTPDELVQAEQPLHLQTDLELAATVPFGESQLGTKAPWPTFVVRYSKKDACWQLGELVLYFRRAGSDDPVKPPFEPHWLPIETSPANLLDIDPPVTDDGGLTWRTLPRMRPGVRLDDYWLLSKGQVELTVRCSDGPPAAPPRLGPGKTEVIGGDDG